MRRKIYNELVNWKKDGAGKTALLIDGARRVGKSQTQKSRWGRQCTEKQWIISGNI